MVLSEGISAPIYAYVGIGLLYEQPQLCLDPPKSKRRHDLSRINEMGKRSRQNTAF